MGGRKVMQKSQGPPYCNTGAANTDPNGLRSLVDWFQVTFKKINSYQKIIEFLGLNESDFYELKKGKFGWLNCIAFENIKIYYGGDQQEGTHLLMSGQACRHFEEKTSLKNTWYDLCKTIVSIPNDDWNAARVDLAVDDFGRPKPFFTLRQLVRLIKKNACRSLFREGRSMESLKLKEGKAEGITLYLGSGSSRIQVRFYEKHWERINKGYELAEGIEVWNRTEIQARDERAIEIIKYIASGKKTTGQMTMGYLKNYINFVDVGINDKGHLDSNKSRWRVSNFWNKFLGDVEKLKLTPVAPDKTLVKTFNWLDNQTVKALYMIFNSLDHNPDLLKRFLNKGMGKLTEKDIHYMMQHKGELQEHFKRLTDQEEKETDDLAYILFDKQQEKAWEQRIIDFTKFKKLKDTLDLITDKLLNDEQLTVKEYELLDINEDEINKLYYEKLKKKTTNPTED
jgi:phage replication initiation protein